MVAMEMEPPIAGPLHKKKLVSIVGLTEFKGRLFCATSEDVYEMIDGRWHPMQFVQRSNYKGGTNL